MKNVLNGSFKNYLIIILKSSLFAIVALITWNFLFRESFKLNPENPEVMSAVVGGFLIFSALLPSFTINELSRQYAGMKRALRKKDFEAFAENYEKSVRPLTYTAIIILSLMAIVALMMMPYERIEVGIFSVGGLSFVHCFFFFATMELDNPKGLYSKIPFEWRVKLEH